MTKPKPKKGKPGRKPRSKGGRSFGYVRSLPSGRYQASYLYGVERHAAPETFTAKGDAEAWLNAERKLIEDRPDEWLPPKIRLAETLERKRREEANRLPLFTDYAERWITERRVKGRPLAIRTQDSYRDYLERFVVPAFGGLLLDEISPSDVNRWHDSLTPTRKGYRGDTGESQRAKVYSFARSVMNTAVSAHGPMPGRVNPFAVRGGGSVSVKRRDLHVATGDDVAAMLEVIRPEWRLAVLLACWCGLRFSELAALRRSDIDLDAGLVRVRRSVAKRGTGETKLPKSDAGQRDNLIPASVLPAVRQHLSASIAGGREGLLFPGKGKAHLSPATFYGRAEKADGMPGDGWYAARRAAGRDDLRFHDLRATGATLLAQNGATEAEIMVWLGDSTPQAASRYIRATESRMRMLSERMSVLAESGQW